MHVCCMVLLRGVCVFGNYVCIYFSFFMYASIIYIYIFIYVCVYVHYLLDYLSFYLSIIHL
jgi:hypothetical protein